MLRKIKLAAIIIAAPIAASMACPKPDKTPMAAEHQSVAAVFKPRTFKPSRMMTPAPKKPMPDTTCAAMRIDSIGKFDSVAIVTNNAAPDATNALVRKPAMRWRNWRSVPINAPKKSANKMREVNSYQIMIFPFDWYRTYKKRLGGSKGNVHNEKLARIFLRESSCC